MLLILPDDTSQPTCYKTINHLDFTRLFNVLVCALSHRKRHLVRGDEVGAEMVNICEQELVSGVLGLSGETIIVLRGDVFSLAEQSVNT